MNNRIVSILEKIDVKAQAGLCAGTHQGARAFLEDIRILIERERAGSISDDDWWFHTGVVFEQEKS